MNISYVFLNPPPGVATGISNVVRDGAGRLQSWIENGCKMTLTYQVDGITPKRLSASRSNLGTVFSDLTYSSGVLVGFTGVYIPTMLLGEIAALGANPWTSLGGGGSVSLSDADPIDLGGSAGPGTGTEASRADHVHKRPSAIQLSAVSLPQAWNALSNTPTALVSGVAPASATAFLVVVGSSGVLNIDGITKFVPGDIMIWQPSTSTWTKWGVDNVAERNWASRGTGAYHGERFRIADSPTGLAMGEWNDIRGQWGPANGLQPWHVSDGLQVAAAVNNAYNPASVNIFGGMLGSGANAVYGIYCDLLVQLRGAGSTSRTVTLGYGATNFVNITSTTNMNRRLGIGGVGFRGNRSTTQQMPFNKHDQDPPEKTWALDSNSNTSTGAGTAQMNENSANTLALSRSVSWLNASSLAIDVIKDSIWWAAA